MIGSGSSYGFDLAAGGGKIRVSDANDKNFVFFGKDTLQQNADAPNKLSLATKNGDIESSSCDKPQHKCLCSICRTGISFCPDTVS